jgi:hypothetical protein
LQREILIDMLKSARLAQVWTVALERSALPHDRTASEI